MQRLLMLVIYQFSSVLLFLGLIAVCRLQFRFSDAFIGWFIWIVVQLKQKFHFAKLLKCAYVYCSLVELSCGLWIFRPQIIRGCLKLVRTHKDIELSLNGREMQWIQGIYNHWRMNCSQFKDLLCCRCLSGTVLIISISYTRGCGFESSIFFTCHWIRWIERKLFR